MKKFREMVLEGNQYNFKVGDIVEVLPSVTEITKRYKYLVGKQFEIVSTLVSNVSETGYSYRVENVFLPPQYLKLVSKK
jgi:hypothetical protein